jgi:anti-anti-sigma factor
MDTVILSQTFPRGLPTSVGRLYPIMESKSVISPSSRIHFHSYNSSPQNRAAIMAEYTPSNLQFKVEQRPGGMVIHLDGELGLPPHTDKLQHELTRIYAQKPKVLVFDLSKLTFCSSLGIGIFANANRTQRSNSGRLKLCCVQPKVMEVFERTRMTAIFEFIKTNDEAFAPT